MAGQVPGARPRRPGARARIALLCAAALLCVGRPAGSDPDVGEVQDLLTRARAAAAAKDAATALGLYVRALRAAEDYTTKYAVRDEVLALPYVPARGLSAVETATVTRRIAEERQRDAAIKAGGFRGRGWLHAARMLHARLKELEGLTDDEENAHAKAIEEIERAICDEATEEERTEAAAVVGTMADAAGAFERAQKLAAEGKGRTALRVLRAIAFSSVPDAAMRDKARAAADALRKRMLEDVPTEQR